MASPGMNALNFLLTTLFDLIHHDCGGALPDATDPCGLSQPDFPVCRQGNQPSTDTHCAG